MWRFLRSLFRLPPPAPPAPEFVNAPPEFSQNAPPDWLLEWRGAILPGGGSFRGRVPLWWAKDVTVADIEFPFSRHRPSTPRPSPLRAAVTRKLLDIVKAAFPEQLLTHPPQCIDGLPVEMVVHSRESYRGVRISCNLGDAIYLWRPCGPGGENPSTFSCVEAIEQLERAGTAPPATYQLAFLLFETTVGLMEAGGGQGADAD